MLDTSLRPMIQPALTGCANLILAIAPDTTANQITILGFLVGLAAMGVLILDPLANAFSALLLVFLSRVCDGLDGTIARIHREKKTDGEDSGYGGFLDIVCDFIFYAGIPFGFALGAYRTLSAETALSDFVLPACFLIFSFVGPISSFLAYAILDAQRAGKPKKKESQKKKVDSDPSAIEKSFTYLGGLCEGTETIACLVAMCLFPGYFALICYVYGAMCWITTAGRVRIAYKEFA